MAVKTAIPKGTRDFSPTEMMRRNYIFSTITKTFQLFGYVPIETPAMELLTTLTGKYGEEGDKLIFKILNSGNFLEGIDKLQISDESLPRLATQLCEKALRYDLTVPFARYVVQNQNNISFPFKRYQIQPVWRADRPQKGRYREFYQCDVDVIGSNSLINELELVQIIDSIFKQLKINVIVKINNRKILSGIAEIIGAPEKITDITVAIDKLDKIGKDKVIEELVSKGLSNQALQMIEPLYHLQGNNEEKISAIAKLLQQSAVGLKGIEELNTVFNLCRNVKVNCKVEFDVTLARGLNYYTGAIFEVKATDVAIGSICGGGRYDDLTGIFGLPDVSGVGVSFGADRIYDVMQELQLFPADAVQSSKIMLTNFGENETMYCLQILQELRDQGISAEMFPETAKIRKQMTWANNKQIPYVGIIGTDEMEKNTISLKNMVTGEQQNVTLLELLQILKF